MKQQVNPALRLQAHRYAPFLENMGKILTLIILIALSSCCTNHEEVKYEVGGTIIQRIDECGKTSFYYFKRLEKYPGKIWSNYSGINDGFSGYLKFLKNGKVLLLSGDGYFQSEGLDTALFEYKRITADQRPVIGDSVCCIQLATKYEKIFNEKSKTGIKTTYITSD